MSVELPVRQFTMVPGQDLDALFLCPLCNDSWADPVELVPCGDIFCHACIAAARAAHAAHPMIMENFQCPQCHTVMQNEKKPNRMLLNTVLEVEVECRYCHWRGTREASTQHECAEGEEAKAVAAAAGASPTGSAALIPFTPSSPGSSKDASLLRSDTELDLSSSTAPAPSKAHPPKRAAGSQSQPPLKDKAAANVASSTTQGLRGPRRAKEELEGAFEAIEDDPVSVMNQTATSSRNAGVPTAGYTGTPAAASSSGGNSSNPAAPPRVSVIVSSPSSGNERQRDNVRIHGVSSPLQQPMHAQSSPPSSSMHTVFSQSQGSTNPSISASAVAAADPWRRYRLSQIEYDQLVGIFMMFDDGTGRLDHRQLRDLCFCMNFVQRDDDVSVIFCAMDTAHKGYVSQDDFLMWLSTHRPDPSALFGLSQFEYTDALLQFRAVDPEYNGVIDANDFCALCMTNGYAATPEEALRYFHLCDARRTGYVSLQQFLQNIKFIRASHGGEIPQLQQQMPVMGTISPGPSSSPMRGTGNSSAGPQTSGNNSLASNSRQVSDYNASANTDSGYASHFSAQQQQQPMPAVPAAPVPLGSIAGNWNHAPQQMPLNPRQQVIQQVAQRMAQRQPQPQPQQPYSQMTRATVNAPAQQQASVPATQQQRTQSRLHRSTARTSRDEECSVM